MSQRSLSIRLKLIIFGIALCGAFFYSVFIPLVSVIFSTEKVFPITWIVFFLISAIPCYLTLWFAYKIAHNIGIDRSFSRENARCLCHISNLAAVDAAYVFVGSSVLFLIDAPELLPLLLAAIIVFVGISVSVAAAALSHLVTKAANLQDESDLTI